MRSSIYCFAADLVGEGVPTVLERVQKAAIGGIAVAAVYHEARDYLPHNPRFRVHHSPPGVAFIADTAAYPRALQPAPLLDVCDGRDVLADAVEAGRAAGQSVDAWVVMLHRDGNPNDAGNTRTAFGDASHATLCPVDPMVADYAVALATDVAQRGVRTIAAEGLHTFPIEHGFHHERRTAVLGEFALFLLSVCFCDACREGARAEGIDADALAAWAREVVEHDLPATERDDLKAYLDLRAKHVMALARRCAAATATHGVTYRFLDPSPAFMPWVDGDAAGPLGVEAAWTFGIDVRDFAGLDVLLAAYARSPQRVADDVGAYVPLVDDGRLSVILRPMQPDCDDGANLSAKLDVLAGCGVEMVDYYHYGLMPASGLEMIASVHRARPDLLEQVPPA
jgi:hypothetical protein